MYKIHQYRKTLNESNKFDVHVVEKYFLIRLKVCLIKFSYILYATFYDISPFDI